MTDPRLEEMAEKILEDCWEDTDMTKRYRRGHKKIIIEALSQVRRETLCTYTLHSDCPCYQKSFIDGLRKAAEILRFEYPDSYSAMDGYQKIKALAEPGEGK